MSLSRSRPKPLKTTCRGSLNCITALEHGDRFINLLLLESLRLANRVTSLILCHDSQKSRARQMAKFIEVARQLRQHHNYAGLRAVTVGILNATYDGDRSMELLNDSNLSLFKTLMSHQKLFASTKAH